MLRFSIIPTQESVRELTLYKPVLDILAKNTGKKIEFYMPTSYSSVVEALLGKWVDVAVLGPESYLIAKTQGANIDVFATYYKKKDGVQEAGPGFKSILITKKGSKFTTVDSVKGSVMLLVDPASTSGSLIPESIFGGKVVKMPLKQYFSKVAFSGGHDLSTARRVRRQGRRRLRRHAPLHERAHREQGQDEGRRLQHPVDLAADPAGPVRLPRARSAPS